MEGDYFELMKKTIDKNIGGDTTINNINMFYVLTNFKNPYNFEDLMRPPLTKKERKYIIDYGAIAGCYKLLEQRCLENIDIEMRPFHCVDGSRTKYLLHTKDDWCIDIKGDKILNGAYPKIKDVYDVNILDTDSTLDREEKVKNLKQLIFMESTGKSQIMKALTKKALLKNNIKDETINQKGKKIEFLTS